MHSPTVARPWLVVSFSLTVLLLAMAVLPVGPSSAAWLAIGLALGFLTARG